MVFGEKKHYLCRACIGLLQGAPSPVCQGVCNTHAVLPRRCRFNVQNEAGTALVKGDEGCFHLSCGVVALVMWECI